MHVLVFVLVLALDLVVNGVAYDIGEVVRGSGRRFVAPRNASEAGRGSC
jgi:hypothetical protein